MPNQLADMLEYFIRKLPGRERAIISLHPHNDRGTGVATTELGLLAGAERVEATLFGNGERTGNVDMVTLAMNMYTQGVDPELDFHDINKVRDMYERCTKMKVGERQPYAGELVFTAFSGSHQDAINKGVHYMNESGTDLWEVPYLPIDPADVGRQYEPIIRINSQSGKGGAAFVMMQNFGYDLPKAMHGEFGAVVQKESDRIGKELKPEQIFELFDHEYLSVPKTYQLERHSFREDSRHGDVSRVAFVGQVGYKGRTMEAYGQGNGPIDAFFNALHDLPEGHIEGYQFVDYKEHAISSGSDTQAVCYIHLKAPDGQDVFGVGKSHNINRASLRAILCAINRWLNQGR